MSGRFARLRVILWTLTGGVVALYLVGLFMGVYGPLELGAMSVLCIVLLVIFTVHEVRLRRALDRDRALLDHTDRERRGW